MKGNDMKLKGKSAIVTGGASGIGRAAAASASAARKMMPKVLILRW